MSATRSRSARRARRAWWLFGVDHGVVTHLDPKSTLADAERRLPLADWRAKVTAAS
jgi:hypothetical protein